MFKLKDKVVYPGHGVAVIEKVIEKVVAGTKMQFYKLDFLYKDMTILLPIFNFENSGVRYPEKKELVKSAINELYNFPKQKTVADCTPSAWNKRHKDYQERIQEGNLCEIAKIYRDLMCIAQKKDLAFGEKNLLQTVEELLAQEIQIVTNRDRECVIQEIQTPFKQFFFEQSEQAISSSM